jgi:hypothetical protein
MDWLVVLFAAGTLLGHACALEGDHQHLADAPARIGSANADSGEPVTINGTSCEGAKPTSVWPVTRTIDGRPFPAPGLAAPSSARAGQTASAFAPRPPLYVLHAALLI